MSWINFPPPAARFFARRLIPIFPGTVLLLFVITLVLFAITGGVSSAQVTVNAFGAATPGVPDSGDPSPVILAVNMYSDLPGKVLGLQFL
jgi:peptidoglycan/LPS O-acetylase OafA/YrhL